MKKRIGYLLGIIAIVLAIVFSYQAGKKEVEGNIKTVIGNSVYNVWEGYNSIIEDSNKGLTIDAISKMNERLIYVTAYSNVIDRGTGQTLLQPIASKISNIAKGIEDNYYQDGGVNEQQQEKYKQMIEAIKEVNEQILKVYYIPNSEGTV
ncbi:hypothetical protein MKY04_05025 [Lysinibacillus telephonicus]